MLNMPEPFSLFFGITAANIRLYFLCTNFLGLFKICNKP